MSVAKRIGQYEIVEQLGRGAMGEVYKAVDSKMFGRLVAVKVLSEAISVETRFASRFEREAKTLAQLSHPNVAGIYGVEEQDENRFLVLEYVGGETLAERLDRGPSGRPVFVGVPAQLLEEQAVAAPHVQGAPPTTRRMQPLQLAHQHRFPRPEPPVSFVQLAVAERVGGIHHRDADSPALRITRLTTYTGRAFTSW